MYERSHKGYLSILFYSVILKCGYQDGRDLSLNFFRMKQWIDLIFFFSMLLNIPWNVIIFIGSEFDFIGGDW